MKLWQKDTSINERIEAFTVGQDRELDRHLAVFDVLGSLAHIRMLQSIGLLTTQEWEELNQELKVLHAMAAKGELAIEAGVEDIHSQVELILTRKLGDTGKKIHSGRSRNDQVLVDMKMYMRWEIGQVLQEVQQLFEVLISLGKKHKQDLMPGYTHMQVAMPSSFGLWFGAYAESLKDDLHMLLAAHGIVNQNPLGSAAGYGSSFPLDRSLTTALLGFDSPNYNVVYAQMTRGKSEKSLATAMAYIAATIGKMAMDVCLYMGQDFGFFTFPEELTTGSSIMPHKKNPDVFEIIRGQCNRLQALPNELSLLLINLPSGYHRELQLVKECLLPAIQSLKHCTSIATFMMGNIQVNANVTAQPKYDYLFTVELVNGLVLQGVPFRDAYKQVGAQIANGTYSPDRNIRHTHLGSIGNPAFEEISAEFKKLANKFDFQKTEQKLATLSQ